MEDSFRIKKKQQRREDCPRQRTSLENSADEVEKVAARAGRAKRLALPDVNTDAIFGEILAEASRDNAVYTTVNSVVNMARRELRERGGFWAKRKNLLRISNLGEEEYREREAQIGRDEADELRFIKVDTVDKLSISHIRGFETFELFLKRAFADFNFAAEHFRDLQEMERQYREKQLWLLDRLLAFSYFQKSEGLLSFEQDYRDKFPLSLTSVRSTHSEGLDREVEQASEAQDDQQRLLQEDGVYQGRERKLISIKLSKFVGAFADFAAAERKNAAALASPAADHFFGLTDVEVHKILRSKNHKTYYDEGETAAQFGAIRAGLLALRERVEAPQAFGPEELSDAELELLINASSFSMNSLHFLKKFDKSDFLICPNDVIYLINKLQRRGQ